MPNLKQSKWEEDWIEHIQYCSPSDQIKFIKDLLAERDIEITNLEEDIEMLEDELKEKDEAWRNYYGIERDKQWVDKLEYLKECANGKKFPYWGKEERPDLIIQEIDEIINLNLIK